MSEKRYTRGPIEAHQAGKGLVIAGHASMFDVPYDLYGFSERVSRGAFRKSIQESDIAALWNHDPSLVLGRKKSGTLRLNEDDQGLHYEVDLPDTSAARDLYKLIERGDVYQSSFSFEVVKDTWEERDDLPPMRTVKEVRLFDVSPVTFPASLSTDVDVVRAMRSLAESLEVEATDKDTVPDILARAHTQDDATLEPEDEPETPLVDTTPEPDYGWLIGL